MRRIVIALLLVVCLTLAFAAPALAQGPPPPPPVPTEMPVEAFDGLTDALGNVTGTPAVPILEHLLELTK